MPVNFRQKDVARAIRAAREVGIEIDRIEVVGDTIRLIVATDPAKTAEQLAADEMVRRYVAANR